MPTAEKLFRTIDAMDTDGFCEFLTEDCVWRYGSADPIVGKDAIRAYVGGLFASLESISHELAGSWAVDEGRKLVVQGEVTYDFGGGKIVTLPFCNVLRLREGRFDQYFVYADPTPMGG